MAAILVCLAGSVFFHVTEILPLFYGMGLAGIAILLPLASGLWAYSGRAARFFIILASIAAFCCMVFLVDAAATQVTFREACQARGQDYEFVAESFDSEYKCLGLHEADYTRSAMLTSPISAALYWPFIFLVLGNVLHAPYLLWRLVCQEFRRYKKAE